MKERRPMYRIYSVHTRELVLEILIDFSTAASTYSECRRVVQLNSVNVVFVDKRTSTVRISGDKAAAAETQRNISQILDRRRKTLEKDPRHVKAVKGTGNYLRLLGSEENVRYPLHWKKEDEDITCRVSLSPQTALFQQIAKLVHGTWEGDKVGIGYDGTGLRHSKIIVKQIFVCKNVALFRQYDTHRKNLCKDASVNRYAPVNGLQGEHEVATRLHITGNQPHADQNCLSACVLIYRPFSR